MKRKQEYDNRQHQKKVDQSPADMRGKPHQPKQNQERGECFDDTHCLVLLPQPVGCDLGNQGSKIAMPHAAPA